MINILVVEKNRAVRKKIKSELENRGYLVIDVSNCEDAIRAFNTFKCALVISDISCDNSFGMSLYNHIRNVPFIAMTDFPTSHADSQSKPNYSDRFVEEPFSTQMLISKVHNILSTDYAYINAG